MNLINIYKLKLIIENMLLFVYMQMIYNLIFYFEQVEILKKIYPVILLYCYKEYVYS